jgi:hypothetical protein
MRAQLFTNSDRAHMERALERLGVDEAVFDAVVCFETMNPHLFGDDAPRAADRRPAVVLKPAVDAIVAGLRAAGSNPRRTVRDSWPVGTHCSLTYYSTTSVRSRLLLLLLFHSLLAHLIRYGM